MGQNLFCDVLLVFGRHGIKVQNLSIRLVVHNAVKQTVLAVGGSVVEASLCVDMNFLMAFIASCCI